MKQLKGRHLVWLSGLFLNLLLVFASLSNGKARPSDNGGPKREQSGMTLDQMKKLVHEVATVIEEQRGFWRVSYGEREIFIVTDDTHNRMRIVTPIIEEEKLTEHHLRIVLLANFDRALDAKYALASDYLWAIFTHPLNELTDEQFLDALEQVRRLADNYGGSYASTDLVFGGGEN